MVASDFKDYYQILGVDKTASVEQIKRAYRKLARKYHPDLNPGDSSAEQRFKEINEAQEVLSDPQKRAQYDRFGQYWQQRATGATPRDVSMNDFSQYGNFNEFIDELLGRFAKGGVGPGSRTYTYRSKANPRGLDNFDNLFGAGIREMPAADIEASIALTFAEAFHGVQRRLQLNQEILNVRIPPGAKPKSRICIKGKGNISPLNHQRGNLYLTVELLPHSFFHFEGDNLVCEIAIEPAEAVLGQTVTIPTPDGKVKLKIPPGVDSGQFLRLREKGWRNPQGKRGDLLVKLKIVTPKKLSLQEQKLYQQLSHLSNLNPRSQIDKITL